MSNPPNILFILTDQQTINAMSATGNQWLSTPAMDSLAKKGARFTKSWCANPVCGPSRASLFSGQMTHQLGAEFNSYYYPDGTRTIGHSFREAGYQTPYVGKWHVHECYPEEPDYIMGFDNIAITEEPRTHLGETVDPYTAQKAAEFLEKPQDDPFFLTVSLLNPHDICYHIFENNEELLGHYWPKEGDELPPLPDNFAIPEGEPEWLQIRRSENKYGKEPDYIGDWDAKRWRQYLFAYYRMTETVDAHIATVLAALEKGGHADDTIVILTSDHGETLAAHELVVKLNLYEEALSVPLIVCDPRETLPGKVIDHWHVSGIDLAPTLLELAGLPHDTNHVGRSFVPALRGEPDNRGYLVAEVYPKPGRPDITARAIQQGEWKYMAYQSDYGFEETLVNLQADPGELTDLLQNEANETTRAKRLELISKLREWFAHTEDDFPTENLV